MYLKYVLIITFILIGMYISVNTCIADDLGSVVGIHLTSGPAFSSKDENGYNVSLHGVASWLNCSLDYTSFSGEGMSRGYLGVGISSLAVIQGGFGDGGGSIKLSSTLPVGWLFNRNTSALFSSDASPRLEWMIKGYVDLFEEENILGLNLGVLF